MADLPKLGIVTLLNSMLDSRDGDKISPIAEPITDEDRRRIRNAVSYARDSEQPCMCGALVKCTAAEDELETVHMIKKENGRAVKVADVEQLNERDITRERVFSGCRFSCDGECSLEEEYIEGKAWQGVDKSVKSDPNMKFKGRLLTEGRKLLPCSWGLNVHKSYMICTRGYGLIYFADAGQRYVSAFLEEAECLVVPYVELNETEQEMELEVEPDTEETGWIPPQIMQLGGTSVEEVWLTDYIYGNSDKDIKGLNNQVNDEDLKWDQEKINIVWKQCEDFYQEYGVQIDPRMMLAIVIEEGTGSFNTNFSELAADGGNGPQSNFKADCENAIDLVGGKIIAYLQYHDDFTEEVQQAANKGRAGMEGVNKPRKADDVITIDILYYLNWETPRLSLIRSRFIICPYAEDNNWHSKVRDIYSNLVDNNAGFEASDYTKYILTLDASIFTETADEKGIDVSKPVTFTPKQNGADSEGNDNLQYTVVGQQS